MRWMRPGTRGCRVTRRLPILPTLFTTLEVSLRVKQNLHFTERRRAPAPHAGQHPAGRRRQRWLVLCRWVLMPRTSPA